MNSETLKNKLKRIVYPIINFIPRRRLKNKNFTIICDNCWAGKVYQELGLPYQTPFVGMFVFSPDYIKMLKNIKSKIIYYNHQGIINNINWRIIVYRIMRGYNE